jgi:hypothetical protein
MGATAQAADYTVDRLDDPAPAGACLPAVPNDCSFRQAVGNTQNTNRPTVDRILFQTGLSGTIHLNGTEGLRTTDPLDIVGPGADVLAVTGASLTQAILTTEEATGGDPVTVSGLTLTGGNAGNGNGGGIYSTSTDLTVKGSTISHNHAAAIREGGGIEAANGELLIKNSTISDNDGGNGGGVHAFETDVGIENSTISGNTATGTGGGSGYGYGGGVWLSQGAGGSLIVYGSTISGNHAYDGGGITSDVSSNALGSTVISNNIATATSPSPDLRNAGAAPFKLAVSLVGSSTGASIADVTGFAGSNVLDVDPQLGPLADNGGPTATMKPALTSPLVDKGIITAAPFDQRGLPRPFDVPSIANSTANFADGTDIGAVELQVSDFATSAPGPAPTPAKPVKKCKKKKKKAKKRAVAAKKCKKRKK